MEELTIASALWSEMLAQAEDHRPEECCGLAAGNKGVVTRVIAVENELHSPVEFRMQAAAQIKAMVELENAGLDLIAIYHSHPEGPEVPSTKDIKQFMYPRSYSIILSRKNGSWKGRGFRITGQTVDEIRIVPS